MKVSLPSRVSRPGFLMVLVTGSRCFVEEFPVNDALDRTEALCDARRLQLVVLQGGASGADRIAREWAWHNTARIITERARWDLYGKGAGPRRNQVMIDKYHPDICLAFPSDPIGPGTADTMARCKAAGIPVFTYVDGAADGR